MAVKPPHPRARVEWDTRLMPGMQGKPGRGVGAPGARKTYPNPVRSLHNRSESALAACPRKIHSVKSLRSRVSKFAVYPKTLRAFLDRSGREGSGRGVKRSGGGGNSHRAVCGNMNMRVQGLSVRLREERRWRHRNLVTVSIALVLASCAMGGVSGRPVAAQDETPAPKAKISSEAVAQASKPSSSFGTTAVGQKAAQFRSDYDKLKSNTTTRSNQLASVRTQTVSNVQSYHALVGGIRSRLQMGSTPGNPELLAQWSQAQTQLTQIDNDIRTLNQLSAQVSADAATSAYLLDSIRSSFSLSGALEEDHRQLRLLEDEVNQNAIVIDRALQGLNDEINRQAQYVASERTSLVQLASDINAGQTYGGMQRRAAPPRAVASITPAVFNERRPLVVIRFDKPDVAYEPALYQALSRALERRPDAVFDLVAVAPNGGNAATAKQKADGVLKSMTGMGLPADRVSETEITSPTAATPEVHVYVQ